MKSIEEYRSILAVTRVEWFSTVFLNLCETAAR